MGARDRERRNYFSYKSISLVRVFPLSWAFSTVSLPDAALPDASNTTDQTNLKLQRNERNERKEMKEMKEKK